MVFVNVFQKFRVVQQLPLLAEDLIFDYVINTIFIVVRNTNRIEF